METLEKINQLDSQISGLLIQRIRIIADINHLVQTNKAKTRADEYTALKKIYYHMTNELEIFEDDLKIMSNADMQRLATKVGVNPFQDRTVLKKILIKEFKDQTKNSRRNIMPTAINSVIPDPNNPKHQKLMKILNDN